MFRLTARNLAANRVRLALTAFAVVLAVSFVVSSFVLTDGLRSQFNELSAEIVAGTDYEVRPAVANPELDPSADFRFGAEPVLPESTLGVVSAIDGVAAAAPKLSVPDAIRPVGPDGQPISANGAPILAFGWVDDPRLAQVALVEGRAPAGPGEMSMDLDAAAAGGFAVGETYDVVTPTGTVTVTLTGLVSFGQDNQTLGATLLQFETETLQNLAGVDGYHSVVVMLEAGADHQAVAAELAAIPDTEVVDQTTLVSEQQAEFNQGIDIIGNVMLGFAGISLFVSIFIIYNTFAIVLGQRTRELALLRTVGAEPAQIRRSVLGEAAAIGLISSAAGIGGGMGLVMLLRALFDGLGIPLPDIDLTLSARTVAVAVAVGLGATLASAIGPARKASLVAPVVALRDGAEAGTGTSRRRLIVGSGLTLIGLGAGAGGLFSASSATSVVALLAVGAMGTFVGVTLLSPLAAGPVARTLGWPLARGAGVAGRLAGDNAVRNPQRTATTAAALMVGLALVTTALVVGESVKGQLRSTLEGTIQADYLVVTDDAGTIPNAATADLVARPEVGTITAFRYERGVVDGQVAELAATDLGAAAELVDLDVIDGVAADPAVEHPLLVADEAAAEHGIEVGDTVPISFAGGVVRELTVIGIFAEDFLMPEDYVLDLATWDQAGATPVDAWAALAVAPGVSTEEIEAALTEVAETYPTITIDTANDLADDMEGIVDGALAAVNVLVALAVIIALIGIANTLALSVFERTRELGLLRAVGMSRRQLRRMVRFEAALVALFGAVMGVALGLGFGWASVAALPSAITSTLAVPSARIVVLVVTAGLAGLVAAWGPARRAARLDVLDAISR